ncbi:hypothetical protein ACFOLA_00895 [Salinicoccus hispanicus]|uniref:Lipoprotein n=1 Tax=Salinicoccus hispanicus TaxID=157225 RepID=A0A6N8U1X8_9STAP|nr:hypothetical protein [Salinicoccus hispanicus]MXQ50141.1 hypothetical protein [Salinicoccus hispanicus]
MKKKSFSLLILVVMILGACSNNSNELEGEVFRVFTWSPDISPEDVSSDNLSPSSGLEFDFKSSDEVEVRSGGETFEGNYSFENNTLSVDLKDENNEESLALDFSDFAQHEQNEKLYTGTISKLDIKTDGHHGVGNNFSLNENLGFYKND